MCVIYRIPKLLCLVLIVLFVTDVNTLVLRAYISQHGLHGEIEFSHRNESLITIRTNLKPTLQYPDGVWRWTIHEYAVDYRDLSSGRCSEASLGKELIDLTEELGYLIVPGKDHAEFESKNSLTGPLGLWGKSIVLETAERDRVICASIFAIDNSHEQYALARFTAPIAGTLNFRWLYNGDLEDSFIEADLYHARVSNNHVGYTEHKWKLFVTDIFDSDKGSHEDNCNVLQLVFDPDNSGDGMSVGDLDSKFGLIKVASDASKMKTRRLYKDEVINILRSDMETTKRNLYVVIFDAKQRDSFLACAKLRPIPPKSTKAIINMDGIKGTVEFTQKTPYDPTWAAFQLGASNHDYESNLRFVGSMLQYSIRELPPKLLDASLYKSICNTTGHLYNPTEVDLNNLPPPGMGTQDQYPIGDLFGKYKGRTDYLNHKYLLPGLANELSGEYWDVFLPLSGKQSVVHRAVVLTRREPKHELCATILQYEFGTEYQTQMSSAQVVFRYPIVGRVVLRQPLERPWEDTTIIIESMVHADGASINNTFEHRWALHARPPGADYYNWTARCLSAGDPLSPLPEPAPLRAGARCDPAAEGLCLLGDLTARHGTLSIAGRKRDSARLTRRLFTDSWVALSGRRSALGRSLVVYDDHGPVARGERMACSIVNGLHRRKAVIQDWFGNGHSIPLKGKLELTQQSEYDITNVQVTLEGLDADLHNYKVHITPIEKELEFPCEKTTIYDTYNPFHVNKSLSPPTGTGTADQYELGDLGEKYGLLDDKKSIDTYYNETQLSLFGPYSIIGRSVAIHRKARDRRWACSSVTRGYSPAEARERRAIASFHHPGGFARGYVRMTQLIHSDGSHSDTVVEVNLKYPGERDTNLTHNHRWEVFVNPVGVDAAVRSAGVRCVAAGYRWNPYFTQLADPLNHDLYSQECGADNPLRCDVGDLTSRLGPISIGGKRQVLVDSNLPLEGSGGVSSVSALGRALVVFAAGGGSDRLACANILPDKDIVKFVNIMKPPRFVLGQFLSDVRRVMGVPEWMVGVDSRRTRVLHHGACLQVLLHFTGPDASTLELDFTRLLASGRLDAPSIYIPGHVDTKRKRTLSYRQCGVTDPNETKKKSFFFSPSSSDPVLLRSSVSLLTFLYIVYYFVL